MSRLVPPLAAALLAATLVAEPGAATERPRILSAGAGAPIGTRLELVGDQGVVHLAGGIQHTLEIPESIRVEQLAPLAEGALLVGTSSRPGGSELWMRQLSRGRAIAIAAPESRAALREGAVAFVARGELAGLAWVEGAGRTRYSVRFASRSGDGWSTPVDLSPIGPGSQLALAGSILADGSWLLVWSAFDGEDDEILWARFDGRTWSRATRLGGPNPVPDTNPAIVAAGTGAIAAWSRYDGAEYRIATARFDGQGWSAPSFVGPPGSLFPSFEASPDAAPRLLYRIAQPRGWAVAALGARGELLRTSVADAPETERPLVEIDASGRARLRWLDRSVELIDSPAR